jgi:hypothetical protein
MDGALMANVKTLQRAFAGGEVSPEMFGRIDDVKYQTGLSTCRNFLIKPQGPAENRPGFRVCAGGQGLHQENPPNSFHLLDHADNGH